MSLKYARFSFVKENGDEVSRIAHILKVVFHYDEGQVETIYAMFPNEQAQARGAQPELLSQKVAVDLTNQDDLMLVLSASDRIWQKNLDQPFIADFSETGEDGKMISTMKSLTELNAEIEEIE